MRPNLQQRKSREHNFCGSSLESWGFVFGWLQSSFVFNWASNSRSCLTYLKEYMEQNKKPGVLTAHVKLRWGKLFSFTDCCNSSLLRSWSDSIFCCIGARTAPCLSHTTAWRWNRAPREAAQQKQLFRSYSDKYCLEMGLTGPTLTFGEGLYQASLWGS